MARKRDNKRGPTAFQLTLLVGAIIILLVFVLRPWPDLQARAAMMGIGLFIIVVAWVRPAGYWEVGSVVLLRELLGDRWVIYLYVLIGVGFAAIAILAQIG